MKPHCLFCPKVIKLLDYNKEKNHVVSQSTLCFKINGWFRGQLEGGGG